jgi:predicted nucleic acid-binding protein
MNGDSFVLDTNIVLYLLNGDKTLSYILDQKILYISFITEIELLGYHKISKKERLEVKQFIDDCIVIDMNSEIKKQAIEIRNQYNPKMGDCLIAATAIYSGLPFVTSDKGFSKIKEMNLVLYNISNPIS